MQSESFRQQASSRSPRPAAREMRLSSSFKALVEAAGASGASTPTSALLNRASDIISRNMRQSSPITSPRGVQQEVAEAPAGVPKLRSCLSLKRHSESPGPAESAAEAGSSSNQSAEHKELHWKPDLVTPSATDHKFEARELQARYLKLEGDLKDSEDAKAMLQKQVHRVQEAIVHSRDEMESAQRLAVAAETTAAAAEAKAAAADAKSEALSKEVEQLQKALLLSSHATDTQADHVSAVIVPTSSRTADEGQSFLSPLPAVTVTPSSLEPVSNLSMHLLDEQQHPAQARQLDVTPLTGQGFRFEQLSNDSPPVYHAPSLAPPVYIASSPGRHSSAAPVRTQSLASRLYQHQPCRADKVPQTAYAAGSRSQSSSPASILYAEHLQTASSAALEKAAESCPSWCESALLSAHDRQQPGNLLHSEVVLETLNRQKHAAYVQVAVSAEPSVRSEKHQAVHSEPSKDPGLSSRSNRYTWLLQNLHACTQDTH